MSVDFNKYASEANEQLDLLAGKLGHDNNRALSGKLLRAVLHAVRDIIPMEESMHMLAQLPMFLKALYVDGWSLKNRHTRIKNLNEFTELVRDHYGRQAAKDLGYEDITFNSIQVVLNFLKQYISYGEVRDIKATMPDELRIIWEAPVTAL